MSVEAVKIHLVKVEVQKYASTKCIGGKYPGMSNPLSNERKDWRFHPLYPSKRLVLLSLLLSLSLHSPTRLSFRLVLFFLPICLGARFFVQSNYKYGLDFMPYIFLSEH